MSSRILLASIAALVVAVVSTGCNDTKTVNRTIPPIAGVTVGGPSDTNGNGQVGVAVSEATAAAVPGTTIFVKNLTNQMSSSVLVGDAPQNVIISVQGDVGNMIDVTLTSEGAGTGVAHYSVPSVAIHNIASVGGETNVVHVGTGDPQAGITGEGFCLIETALTTNRVFIDGTALEGSSITHASGDGLQFHLPLTLSTNGTHSVQVTVGNSEPGNPTYTSNTLIFAAVH